jgi:hypothetical protein
MGRRVVNRRGVGASALVSACLLALATFTVTFPARAQQQSPATTTPANANSGDSAKSPVFPRGKKLVLKDGNIELVREYKIEGDRIRYYSLDTSSWEVMPADLVDWDATKKLEAQQSEHDAAMLEKVHTQEAARIVRPLDIDASLEVAPGIFLPEGDNLFAFDGKNVSPLPQAETTSKVSKGRLLEQIMVPVPIIPSRQNVTIHGASSKFRLRVDRPEFYFRTKDLREPRIDLVRAKPHGDTRLIEHLDELFGEKAEIRDSIPMQKWEMAQGVYRFTLSQPLPPGEYAIAEIVQDEGVTMYVWDFGVEGNGADVTVVK